MYMELYAGTWGYMEVYRICGGIWRYVSGDIWKSTRYYTRHTQYVYLGATLGKVHDIRDMEVSPPGQVIVRSVGRKLDTFQR